MKKKRGKVLGVLGGMGPLATQLFFRMVVEKTDAGSDQEHINMIILNHATVPDRTVAIMNNDFEEILEMLVEDAKYLEAGGADVIAMPCNTAFAIFDQLQSSINTPIINMIEAAAEQAAVLTSGKVAILATDGTVKTELYQKALKERGIEPYVPSAQVQKQVMKLIYESIKESCGIDYEAIEAIDKEIKENGCEYAILACTELSCIKYIYGLSDKYIDAMEIMARKAILMCDKDVKGEFLKQ